MVVAGLPQAVGAEFVQKLHGQFKQLGVKGVSWLPKAEDTTYCERYARRLYERTCSHLCKAEPGDRFTLLNGIQVVLLYVEGSTKAGEDVLFKQFGVEALVTPLRHSEVGDLAWVYTRDRKAVVNSLLREARRALSHATDLLVEVNLEVTNRDAKTCLLLPPRNFPDVQRALGLVRTATARRMPVEEFRTKLRSVEKELPRRKEGGRWSYVRGPVLFQSPKKAGARHALPPTFEDGNHDLSCVLRGRLRCGTTFRPGFHYDCQIAQGRRVAFEQCHGDERRWVSGNTYMNIAPNDHVRGNGT